MNNPRLFKRYIIAWKCGSRFHGFISKQCLKIAILIVPEHRLKTVEHLLCVYWSLFGRAALSCSREARRLTKRSPSTTLDNPRESLKISSFRKSEEEETNSTEGIERIQRPHRSWLRHSSKPKWPYRPWVPSRAPLHSGNLRDLFPRRSSPGVQHSGASQLSKRKNIREAAERKRRRTWPELHREPPGAFRTMAHMDRRQSIARRQTEKPYWKPAQREFAASSPSRPAFEHAAQFGGG